MSGIDAVKRIVETEEEARRIVDQARQQAQDVVAQAARDAESVKDSVLSDARKHRDELLARARTLADQEANQSDKDTEELIGDYQKAFESRREDAVRKAVELILEE